MVSDDLPVGVCNYPGFLTGQKFAVLVNETVIGESQLSELAIEAGKFTLQGVTNSTDSS
jgi:hypothetical protein